MTIRISKSEMELLGYLHEHATRFDGKERFHPEPVATALGTTEDQIQRSLSFLAQYHLVGTTDTFNSKFKGVLDFWLSHKGENLMRKVEEDLNDQLLKAPDYTPSRGVKITLKAAGYLMDTAKDIVVAVVANSITGH